jgi:hypothetical protein
MPTVDRKPRRRLNSARVPDFTSERDAAIAADAVAALPDAERADAWRELKPRICRWILTGWGTPKQQDDAWMSRVAD